MSFGRIVQFSPAYDKRSADPSKNYGIHGVTLRFVLKGTDGAVSWTLFTNWQLPHVQREQDDLSFNRDPQFLHLSCHPMPADLSYHSPRRLHEWNDEAPSNADCAWLDGKPCWCDGSTLNAEPVYEALLIEGDEGVWRKLEAYYAETFLREAVDA